MAMRMSGLMSGMDTESIIKELVSVKQTKVDDAKKAQTKLEAGCLERIKYQTEKPAGKICR